MYNCIDFLPHAAVWQRFALSECSLVLFSCYVIYKLRKTHSAACYLCVSGFLAGVR